MGRTLLRIIEEKEGLAKAKETFDRDILIEVFPMNAQTAADQLPIVPIFWGRIHQTGIPLKRNADHSAICERDAQRFVIARNVDGKRLDVYRRNAHDL
jgi:hypothetical protein